MKIKCILGGYKLLPRDIIFKNFFQNFFAYFAMNVLFNAPNFRTKLFLVKLKQLL